MESFKKYQFQKILANDGSICHGDYHIEEFGLIIRCDENGYLNDVINPEDNGVLPAIEFLDGSHIEHWKNGLLHCETGPAVIDVHDNYKEFWKNGYHVDPSILGE